jgi:hypothetical protein
MPDLILLCVIPIGVGTAVGIAVLAAEYWIIQPKRKGGLKIRVALERFPVLVPADYAMEHGRAETLQLKLDLFNLTSPPRAVHLSRLSIAVWPGCLPFLKKEYSLGRPLIGEDPEKATSTVDVSHPVALILSASPIIDYIRGSPFENRFVALIQIIDESGAKHKSRIEIPVEIAKQTSRLLTLDDYRQILQGP